MPLFNYLAWILAILYCRILPGLSLFVGLEDDSEGSGYDSRGSGFDSDDWSVEDGDQPKRPTTGRDDLKADDALVSGGDGGEPVFRFPGDSGDRIDYRPGHGSAAFSVDKLKTLMKTKEAIAGAIGGGVTGLILATVVASVVIYKRKMNEVGYTL